MELIKSEKMDLSAYGDEFTADSDSGFEDTNKDSYAIPFIRMIQSTSGVMKKSSEFYIKGATAGQLLNTLTRDVSDSIYVVPVHQETRFDLKRKESNGYKFLGSYDISSQEVAEALEAVDGDKYHCFDKEGAQFFETSYLKVIHFSIVDGKAVNAIPAMISFSSYNLEVSKNIMTRCRMGDGGHMALHTNVLEIGTTTKTKDANEWFIYTFKHLGKIPQLPISNGVELFSQAKDFHATSKTADVNKMDHASE